MTKKEAAAHQEEVDRLKLRLALCWTPEVKPDLFPPDGVGTHRLTKGWLTSHDTVDAACSSACYHGRGRTTETTTQGARLLFSTRLLALQAVRHEMEKRFARELRRIDCWIELEEKTPTPLPDK